MSVSHVHESYKTAEPFEIEIAVWGGGYWGPGSHVLNEVPDTQREGAIWGHVAIKSIVKHSFEPCQNG